MRDFTIEIGIFTKPRESVVRPRCVFALPTFFHMDTRKTNNKHVRISWAIYSLAVTFFERSRTKYDNDTQRRRL